MIQTVLGCPAAAPAIALSSAAAGVPPGFLECGGTLPPRNLAERPTETLPVAARPCGRGLTPEKRVLKSREKDAAPRGAASFWQRWPKAAFSGSRQPLRRVLASQESAPQASCGSARTAAAQSAADPRAAESNETSSAGACKPCPTSLPVPPKRSGARTLRALGLRHPNASYPTAPGQQSADRGRRTVLWPFLKRPRRASPPDSLLTSRKQQTACQDDGDAEIKLRWLPNMLHTNTLRLIGHSGIASSCKTSVSFDSNTDAPIPQHALPNYVQGNELCAMLFRNSCNCPKKAPMGEWGHEQVFRRFLECGSTMPPWGLAEREGAFLLAASRRLKAACCRGRTELAEVQAACASALSRAALGGRRRRRRFSESQRGSLRFLTCCAVRGSACCGIIGQIYFS